MKLMASILLATAISVFAQGMPGGPPPDPCAALAKFLTNDVAFTATAKVVGTGMKKSDNVNMTMFFAVSGGNLRNEMDLTKMSGVRASDLDGMKQMGMDKMVILKLTDKHAAYIVYPNMQSYCDMPGGKARSGGKVVKSEIGADTVENHPCTKSKLIYTDADGTAEALVWEATDMKKFPVQYQTVDEGRTTTTTFTNIKMGQPDAALFELPAGFQHYSSMQEMMMGAAQRMMQNMGQ
jgi:hypothetical protein